MIFEIEGHSNIQNFYNFLGIEKGIFILFKWPGPKWVNPYLEDVSALFVRSSERANTIKDGHKYKEI